MYEHNNSLMYDYFIPFIHFIPVSNVHQFMCYSQFFLENEDLMTSMTKSTKEFYINHYSSKKFWTKLIEKLSIDKC